MTEPGPARPALAYKILVLANAVPGREAEFDRWYTERHVPGVLGTPGFKSAQRFELAATQVTPNPGPHRYVTIYEVETSDIQAVLDELTARRAAGKIARSDDIAPDAIAYVLQPITDMIRAHTASNPQVGR